MADLYRVARTCLASLFLLFLFAQFGSAAGGKLYLSTTWDDNYLYAGFLIEDSNVTGSNRTPNSKPWEDDSIQLFLDAKREKGASPSADTYRMVVSAASGSSFADGKGGDWQPKQIFTYKYWATVQGTLNNSDDTDRSFSVEMALPWSEIGGRPQIGQVLGLNVVRIMKGELDALVSLSPEVHNPADSSNPSKWVELLISGPGSSQQAAGAGKVVCPKADAAPLIDGALKSKEWPSTAFIEVEQPSPEPKQASEGQPGKRATSYANERLVFSPYYYWYQADPTKALPVENVRLPDGSPAFADQPLRGVGPWMSYDRVRWHKDEILDMKASGIDVIMPVYRGDAVSRKGYADRGLARLSQALMQLKTESQTYPLVAMFFDTSAMPAAYGGTKPDLRNEEVQKTFYGMISDFFARIPEEFLAITQLDQARNRSNAYIVYVSDSRNFSDFDGGFIKYCNNRFARDFGMQLVWMGDPGFAQKAPSFDAYASMGGESTLQFNDAGWLHTATISPGYDNCAVGDKAKIRPRLNGDNYAADWTQLVAKKPDWILLDSWNGLADGDEICPTSQYGVNYHQMTGLQVLRQRGMRELDALYLRNNVPSYIVPQAIDQVEVTVKNAGTQTWYGSQGYLFSYRWYKDGKYYEDGVVRVPLQTEVRPTETARLSIGIVAQDRDGRSLPPGDYDLHFEMLLPPDKWFSDFGDVPLVIPVHLGLPAFAKARFISCDLPAFAKSGGMYPFTAKVRNDGANSWKLGTGLEAICKLYKVNSYKHDSQQEEAGVVNLAPVRLTIPSNTDPGRVAELSGTLRLVDTAGKPIPANSIGDPWSYRVRIALWADKKWLGESDGPYCQTLDVLDSDYDPQFLTCQMPKELEAGKSAAALVTLANSGSEAWKGATQLGYRWYNIDGTESGWPAGQVSLKSVTPGQVVSIAAKPIAPKYDGQYYLVWDVLRNGKWVSGAVNGQGGDILAVPVTVRNGDLSHVDLSGVFNIASVSPDNDPKMGDFDGSGHSFPAEFLPPEMWPNGLSDVIPTGYRTGDGSVARKVTFRYPRKAADIKSAVKCDGQAVAVKEGKYSALHILGAAVADNAAGDLGLRYDTGSGKATVTMTSWQAATDEIAVMTPHRHSQDGNEPSAKCYLKHYTVRLDPTRKLTGIELPRSAEMRIVAITLQK